MEISTLFSESVDPTLRAWINSHTQLGDLFASIPQLYAKLHQSSICGNVEEGATVIGPVHLGQGSTICSRAIVVGPVVIGNNVCIDNNAQISRGTFMGSDCFVGSGALVEGSLCMDKARIDARTVVRNSVLGVSTYVGPLSILGAEDPSYDPDTVLSRRLGAVLGDHVYISAACVLARGTVIGPQTSVGPGTVLEGVYDPDLLIKSQHGVEATPKSK